MLFLYYFSCRNSWNVCLEVNQSTWVWDTISCCYCYYHELYLIFFWLSTLSFAFFFIHSPADDTFKDIFLSSLLSKFFKPAIYIIICNMIYSTADDTFQDVFRDFTNMASNNPEKLKRKWQSQQFSLSYATVLKFWHHYLLHDLFLLPDMFPNLFFFFYVSLKLNDNDWLLSKFNGLNTTFTSCWLIFLSFNTESEKRRHE